MMNFIQHTQAEQYTLTDRQTDWQTDTTKTKWKEKIKIRIKTNCSHCHKNDSRHSTVDALEDTHQHQCWKYILIQGTRSTYCTSACFHQMVIQY